MIEARLFDGTVLRFPEGTDPAIIQGKVKEITMQRRAAAGERVPTPFTPEKLERLKTTGPNPASVLGAATADAQATEMMNERSLVDTVMQDYLAPAARTVANFSQGIGQGVVNFYGTPANIASASPQIANLLPGDQNVPPMPALIAQQDPRVQQGLQALFGPLYPLIKPATTSDGRVVPAAGSERITDLIGQGADAVTDATGVPLRDNPAFENVTLADRFAERVGQEIGFTAPALRYLLKQIAQSGTNLASRAASTLAGKETAIATTSGITAQGANEIAEATGMTPANDGQVGNLVSDTIGSLTGSLLLPPVASLAKSTASLASGAVGSGRYLDDVAEMAVRDMALENSVDANRFAAETGSMAGFDTTELVNRLRSPAAIEDMVPGYRASTGQRLQDPMLMSMEDALDGSKPGASNVRRIDNNDAVNRRITELAPTGDPASFRNAIQASVDARLADSNAAVGSARAAYDEVVARLQVLEDNAPAVVRGSAMREGLQEVYDAELAKVSAMMQRVENSGLPVDLRALKERFDSVSGSLAKNDRVRFSPVEENTLRGMVPKEGDSAPVPSAVLDASGRPIMRDPPPAPDASAPINEVMAIRSGLTNDIGAAVDEPRRRFVLGEYRSALDDFFDEAVPEELRGVYRDAVAARADVGTRFESNDAVGRALQTDGRGSPVQRPEQLPGALVPASDAGNVTDYAKMMREAGSNPRVRQAVSDTVALRAQKHITDPIAMAKFIDQNNIVLADFPDLRANLEQAGATKSVLDAAENASAEVSKRLTTPGRSPEASYLRYGDNDVVSSMRTVVSSDRPAESVKALLDATGRTPEAVNGAKAALWRVITEDGQNSASLMGQKVWNPRMAAETMRDPKIEAAARELWGQDYGDFEVIRNIFEQLEASRPGQLRSAGNPAGTAAAVAMSPSAKLSPARISADLRAVSQNRTSPVQVAIQWTADKLRNMSASKQQAWIDRLMRASIDDPGRLADILEKYNPALESMANRNVTGWRGFRGSQAAALFEELAASDAQSEDDMLLENIFGGQ